MKKIIQTLAILVLAIFLAGCGPKEQVDIGSTFIGGTEGLDISFRQGVPPAEVWDGNTYPFDISVDIENKGEWDVMKEDVKVQLSGFNPAAFNVKPEDITKQSLEDVTGLSRDSQGNIIPATRTSIDFSGFSYEDVLASDEQYNLIADICYSYGAKATSKICVIQNLRTDDSRVCKVNEAKELKNSGSPLQISELTESSAGQNDIQVTFKITNMGTGDVYQTSSKCPQNLTAKLKNQNKVYVKINSGLDLQPKCQGIKDATGVATPEASEGYVNLINGEAIVSCKQSASTVSDFEQLINIELQYDYAQTIQQPLLVKRTG